MQPGSHLNPFPGLRPFESDEDHLFFGREKEINDLLRRLRSSRFVSVVGTSGSGKSSLVRCGLIPSLHSGFMVNAGSSWRVATFRPGEDPVVNLAACLNRFDVLGIDGELPDIQRMLLETTLRRSTAGLIEAIRQARIPRSDNLLLIIDQFEELFRFRSRHVHSRDQAVSFVKLLLEATQQEEVPIYVVLTMRSDFIGDCMNYPGLPEAVNAGQYLVPRMTRSELHAAISGPVAVAGAEITQRLVLRLLNDIGEDQDRLPVLQHALMRTWDYWDRRGKSDKPIDIADYEAIGTLSRSLSLHAEEAYSETGSERDRRIAERSFKALTDTFSDPRGTRRPASIKDLTLICEASEEEVVNVIEIFRQPGRSFLMPPATVPLTSGSIIDLSHESLMRCWTRLVTWTEEERASAATYMRVSQAASWFEQGTAGLWRNPELEIGLSWKRREGVTATWAERYDFSFARAMDFLARSEREQLRVEAEREQERKRKLRQVQTVAVVLATMLLVALSLAYIAWKEQKRAQANLQLAKIAVDESLSSAEGQQAREAADIPQLEQFRQELLEKARNFYVNFLGKQEPEQFRGEIAQAHARLGDINRLLEKPAEAVKEYQTAISQFDNLGKQHSENLDYQEKLAYSYNWLGETLRTWIEGGQSPFTRTDAENAYNDAIRVQERLLDDRPGNPGYRQDLARTYYNRAILGYDNRDFGNSETDFRQAIQMLVPIAGENTLPAAHKGPEPAQDLARAYNDLANLLRQLKHLPESRDLYEQAITLEERLSKKDPANREYKIELAQFYDNLALLCLDEDRVDLAEGSNREALSLFAQLATPPSSLGVQQAKAHVIRMLVLDAKSSPNAQAEVQNTLEILGTLKSGAQHGFEVQGIYATLGDRYAEIALESLKSGSLATAQRALNDLSSLLPELSERDRIRLTDSLNALQQQIRHRLAR
jgi:energy-coupling factor transporter ATP-binding protein EcfA2